jgi:hypothetical protein
LGSIAVAFKMADAGLDGGEPRLLGIDAPGHGGAALEQAAHALGRGRPAGPGGCAPAGDRAQHHQRVQVVELYGRIIAIAGRSIDMTGLQEADGLVGAAPDRNAAAVAEFTDPEQQGGTVASPYGESRRSNSDPFAAFRQRPMLWRGQEAATVSDTIHVSVNWPASCVVLGGPTTVRSQRFTQRRVFGSADVFSVPRGIGSDLRVLFVGCARWPLTKQRLVVVGNGMAPGRALERLFETSPDKFDVTIFNAEPRVNYDRIMLSPVLSGEKQFEDIIIHGDAGTSSASPSIRATDPLASIAGPRLSRNHGEVAL